MRVKEFKDLSKEELLQKADECFEVIEKFPAYHQLQATKLLEAQFYMNEVDRRDDEAIATRDFKMAARSYTIEKWVIVLIGAEILIALAGLWYGIHEGAKQASILSHMEASTAATASATQNQAMMLSKLTDQETQSLDSLAKANENLMQMNETVANQLKIVKSEKEERAAQQNLRPVLELRALDWEIQKGYRAVLVKSDESRLISFLKNSENPTETNVVLYFRNVGNAPVVNADLVVRPPPRVVLRCVDYPNLGLFVTNPTDRPCQMPSTSIPTINPRLKDRATKESDGVDFDPAYDFYARVNLIVPLDIKKFDLEILFKADKISPIRYRVQCHSID